MNIQDSKGDVTLEGAGLARDERGAFRAYILGGVAVIGIALIVGLAAAAQRSPAQRLVAPSAAESAAEQEIAHADGGLDLSGADLSADQPFFDESANVLIYSR